MFVGATVLNIGVYDAVISSMKVPTAVSVMERMDIKPGENMKKSLRDIDCQRVAKAEKAAEMMTKEARMKKRGRKRKREDK